MSAQIRQVLLVIFAYLPVEGRGRGDDMGLNVQAVKTNISPRRFRDAQSGSVSILAAAMIAMLLFAVALSIDAANLYVAKSKNQRVADLANLAAGATPSAIVGVTPSPTAIATAANLAAINGLGSAAVETLAVPSPGDASNLALSTKITRDIPRFFPHLVGAKVFSTVRGTSIANVGSSNRGACLASLLGPTNIYGSSSASGPTCAVSSATYLYACGRATVAMARASVGYPSSAEAPYLCSSASVSPAPSVFAYRAATTDTIAAKSDIVAIKTHLAAMGSPGWPFGSRSPKPVLSPSVTTGADQTYASTGAVLPQTVKYGTLTITSANLTFRGTGTSDPNCTTPTTISGNVILNGTSTLTFNSGCYVIAGYILARNGANAAFSIATGSDVTFVFKQYISNGSGTISFPNATYSISGDIINIQGGNLTFGCGSKVFGAGINNGSGNLSFLCGPYYVNGGTITNGSGTMTFGDGAFYLWGGSISNSGTGTMAFGNGPFTFYGGTVTNVSGTMNFGNGPFYFNGGSLTLLNNSRTRFGIGNMDFYGGTIAMGGSNVTFGYNGSPTTGASTVSLYGGSFSLTAQSLTAIGVTFTFSGGTISLLGVGTINATAPTTANPAYGYQNILFVVFGGAFNLYQSSNVIDTMSGIIYAPNSNASIYGMQTVNYSSGGCFQLVAGVVDIYQNAHLNFAPCNGLTVGSSGGAPSLAQ